MDHHFIDIYCERTTAAVWDEPLNALSNLSFLIAALLAARALTRRGQPDFWEIILIFLGGLIGIGSFLFHIFPYPWAELSDVVPIWSFVGLFILVTIYRSTGQNLIRTARIAAIAVAVTGLVFWLTSGDVRTEADNAVGPLNGSLQYAPALAALAVFAGLTQWRGHPARWMVTGAALTFVLALAFRSLDLAVCATWPLGTHFLWHTLNGCVVGFMLFALVRHMPPVRP